MYPIIQSSSKETIKVDEKDIILVCIDYKTIDANRNTIIDYFTHDDNTLCKELLNPLTIKYSINSPHVHYIFLALHNTKLLSFAFVQDHTEPDDEHLHYIIIEYICAIQNDANYKGYGSVLMDFIKRELAKLKSDKKHVYISLESVGSDQANNFYKRHKFTFVGNNDYMKFELYLHKYLKYKRKYYKLKYNKIV